MGIGVVELLIIGLVVLVGVAIVAGGVVIYTRSRKQGQG